jgi:dephospho-CoA kinase
MADATPVPPLRIVGLTGGIGAGKSTVAALLAERGAVVVDVDGLGRTVIAPGGPAEQAVLARFGDAVRTGDGHVDRARLAGIVFRDPAALAALEAISHPAINAEIDSALDDIVRRGGDPLPVVVLDMAILYGSRLGQDLPSGRRYDTVVAVEASEQLRVQRLVASRGMAEADARARLASQPTDEQRRSVAHHVVTNDGDLDALARQVDGLASALGITAR